MRASAVTVIVLCALLPAGCGAASASQPIVSAPVNVAAGGPGVPSPTHLAKTETPDPDPGPGPELLPTTVVGLAHTGRAEGAAVLLASGTAQMVVPIYIGGTEAMSIELRLQRRHYERPLTHDLMDHVLRELGAEIVRVQVDDLKNGTYLGTVVMRAKGQLYKLDARPSDAIALALGSDAPIYLANGVITAASEPLANFALDDAKSGATAPMP